MPASNHDSQITASPPPSTTSVAGTARTKYQSVSEVSDTLPLPMQVLHSFFSTLKSPVPISPHWLQRLQSVPSGSSLVPSQSGQRVVTSIFILR